MRATVQHFELPVEDLDRAAAFYRRVFGWAVQRLSWDGPEYCTVRVGGLAAAGLEGGLMGREELGAEHPLLVIHIEGATLEQALKRVEEAGGTVVQPPRPVGEMGRWARFRDSEGNLLGLWRDRE